MKSKRGLSGLGMLAAVGAVIFSISSTVSAAPVLGGWITANGSDGKPAYYNDWASWGQSWGAAVNYAASTKVWFMVPNLHGGAGTMRVYSGYGGANGQSTCGQAVVLTMDAAFYSATASVCTVPYRSSNPFGDMYVPSFGSIMMVYSVPPQGFVASMSVGTL